MDKNICIIYNFAQHYRREIFILLDKELKCDFVFGDKMGDVIKMNYSELKHFKKEVKNIKLKKYPFYYQVGVLSLLWKNYKTYIILGDLHCISTWIFLLLSKLLNKKIYLWSHGWYGRESKITKKIKLLFFNLANGVFLYGFYAKQLMLNEGFSEKKLHVIHNSLSYDLQLAIRKSIKPSTIYIDHFKNINPNLIFIGRLTKEKKLDMLLDVLLNLRSQSLKVNLTIIGEGESLTALRQKAAFLEIENVWFLPSNYDEKELSALIYNAELCISPGNVGLTAIHSMSYGTPVLTHNNFPYQGPEFEAIVEGITGSFFEYGNIDSLADRIIYMLDVIHTKSRDFIREKCYNRVDSEWNPHYQIKVFKRVLTNQRNA